MSSKIGESLLASAKVLFYVSAIFGVIPYSLREFFRTKTLKISIVGNVWVLVQITVMTAMYHLATNRYAHEDKSEQKNLTSAIGIFIIYLEPLMMSTDMLASLFNQRTLIRCMGRMESVDQKLSGEGIAASNEKIRRTVNVFLLLTVIFETIIAIYSFVEFESVYNLVSTIWFVTILPTALNSVSRIWFVMLVLSVRHRFNAMNGHMDAMAKSMLEHKELYEHDYDIDENKIPMDYLEKEIYTIYNQKKMKNLAATPPQQKPTAPKIIQVRPFMGQSVRNDGKSVTPPTDESAGKVLDLAAKHRLKKIEGTMDNKLILICRMHDELCEIGKIINRMFSVQMLLAMAHGFVAITAQFYFLYCSLSGQTVPILFRSTQVLAISLTYIFYTSVKCVIPIFICWKTKTESHRTGIAMHYLANVVDETHFYEVVNHLSLKLLNHQLNFSACGFFDLDMTTLYAIAGAISSYLIILIQFNLAGMQKLSNSTAVAVDNGTTTTTVVALLKETTTAISTYVAN